MVYLYAIAAPDVPPLPELRGIEEAQVRRAPAGPFVAVVSEHDALALEPSDRAVARHAEVVERLMDAGTTLLPARFGRAFAHEGALAAAVETHADALAGALTLVRGCVELGVRVVRRGATAAERPPPPASGRAYMQALLERQTLLADAAAEVHEPLTRLSVRTEQRLLGTATLLLSAAYLVRRERVEDFRAAVERLQRDLADVAIVCTGPWPPYSFVPEAA